MAYTTLVSGTTITASWANASVRDQAVSPFASTGARDSAITSPVVGMVSYISSNDTAEGVVTRTSGSTWRLPWNMPWGNIGDSRTGVAQAGIGVTFTLLNNIAVSFTAVANRKIRATAVFDVRQRTAAGLIQCKIQETVAGTDLNTVAEYAPTVDAYQTIIAITNFTPAAGARTIRLSVATSAGTVSLNDISGTLLTVEDIGPSGAPA
jgi:hypothetical protein